jgi:hypothetical protein
MPTVEIESCTGEKVPIRTLPAGLTPAEIRTYDRRAGLTLDNDPVLYLIPDADRIGESVVSILPAL